MRKFSQLITYIMNSFQAFYFLHEAPVDFVLFIIGTVIVAYLVTMLFKNVLLKLTAKTETELDDEMVKMMQRPVYWGVILGGFYLALRRLSLFEQYMSTVVAIVKVGFIVILLIAAIKLSNVIFGWANGKKLKKKQTGFVMVFQKIVNALIYFIAIIFVLQAVGISITPLVASLGVGGLVIGLALQPTLLNYFSGLYVVADGFVKPEDYIELDNGLRGYVVSVGWRNTIIRMWNNNLVMIPNSKLADSMITNYNEPQNKSSFIVECGVAYNTDLRKAEKIALEVADKIQKKKKYGVKDYKPVVRFYEFADSNINLKVVMQSDQYKNHYEMKHDFIKDIKNAYDKAGITISFPMHTLDFPAKPIEISLKNK
jgi:small-conductance mechanosensitive channel